MDAVEKEGSQPQMSPVEVSSEQSPIMVISSPSSNQHIIDSYSISPVNEVHFIILEEFEFHCRNKLGVTTTIKLLISHHYGGVSDELKLLLDCLAPSTGQEHKVARVRKNYSTYEGYEDYEEKAMKRAMRFYPP